MLGPLVDEPGACGRGDRGEGLAVVAHLDVEVAGVGLRLFASCTGVLHDEARHRANRTQIHLQEQGPLVSAPLIGLASRHAAVHGFFRPLILAARLTAGGGAIEREVLLAFRPIDLEFVNPRNRLSAVGRPTDIQPDETGIDRRLDDVGGRPCVGGALADAACLCRRVLLGRLSQPLLDVLRGLSLADAVHEGRTNHTALRQPVDPQLRIETVPEEDGRGQEREHIDPERALGEEGSAQLDPRNRPRLPGLRARPQRN